MEENNLKEQIQKVVDQLTIVKNEFIKNKEELAVSIRKDVVVAELRGLLDIHKDYNSLCNAIRVYIENLLNLE